MGHYKAIMKVVLGRKKVISGWEKGTEEGKGRMTDMHYEKCHIEVHLMYEQYI